MDNQGFDDKIDTTPSAQENDDSQWSIKGHDPPENTSSRRQSKDQTRPSSSDRNSKGAMSDNPAFEAGPEDATDRTDGKYKALDPQTVANPDPLYAQIAESKKTEEKAAPLGSEEARVEVPESVPSAYKYSAEKKALEALGEVIEMAENIRADKPYAGMGKEDLLRFSQTPYWSRFRTVCTIVFWAAWAALLGAVIGLTITFPKCVPPPEQPWHETAVMYQVYVRSFYDSDGDGIGDLNGIRMKLDYLSELRVDALILSSFYQNNVGPNPDFGYEVVDHKNVSSEYGTMQDFEMLLEEAHEYGIRIILDFIPNYTGSQHPWFAESSKSSNVSNPYWNYYVWADCPVNNWRTVYGESMWSANGTRGGSTDQCYLHQCLDTQPELNLRSKAVQAELEAILRFWLDKGVDGFRVDKVQHLFEDADLKDEPLKGNCQAGDTDYSCYDHIYTVSQDEIYPLVAKWREVLDEYSMVEGGSPRVLLTDASDNVVNSLKYYGEYGPDGAHMPLNYELTRTNESCHTACVWKLADDFLYGVPTYAVANWMTGTQDKPRFSSVIQHQWMQNAYTMLKLTMPGTPILYYGEEIGMTNVNLTGSEDPAGNLNMAMSRDPYRTPMQWSMDPDNAGFIDEEAVNATGNSLPWLPVGDRLWNISVQAQNASSDIYTPYWFYRSLVDLRNETRTLVVGSFQYTLLTQSLVSYYRAYEGLDRFLVALNFGPDSGEFNIKASYYGLPDQADIAMATRPGIEGPMKLNKVYLEPGDGVLLTWPYVRPDGK